MNTRTGSIPMFKDSELDPFKYRFDKLEDMAALR